MGLIKMQVFIDTFSYMVNYIQLRAGKNEQSLKLFLIERKSE